MKRILKLIVWVMLMGLPVVMTSCDLGFFDNPVSPDLKVLKPSITVQVGKSYRCNVHASTKAKLTFTSADPSIATVDSYGVVTGVKTGKTTIAVKTSGVDDFYNSIFYVETATIDVEVIKLDVPVKSVKLDKTELAATVGDEPVTLKATVAPDNATNKTVTWKSSNTDVATVDEDGVVTFVGGGTATVTATATNGTTDTADDKTATCTVTVNAAKVNVTSVTLSETSLEKKVGDAVVTLTATVAPADAGDKTVTWKSSNTSVATVDASGKVSIIGVGTATITCTATNGTEDVADDKTATCTVTVKYPGLLAGKFSVSATKQVQFSQGNLQAVIASTMLEADCYTASSWKLAEHQWDYIGSAAGNTTFAPGSTVDLFGWVGSSVPDSKNTYGLCTYNSNSTTYFGSSATDALKHDWGTLTITNGGNTPNFGWRTLSSDEWAYLFNTRTSGSTVSGTSNACYTFATINTDNSGGVNGIILFPDGVTIATSEATSWGYINGGSSWGTKCTTAQWTVLAAKGCVFLPAAGCRQGLSVNSPGSVGRYWSSSSDTGNASNAYQVYFSSSSSFNTNHHYYRYYGQSVRLVRDAE